MSALMLSLSFDVREVLVVADVLKTKRNHLRLALDASEVVVMAAVLKPPKISPPARVWMQGR